MCPDWKSSLWRALSYQICLSFWCEEQDPTPRTRVAFSVLCISPVKWLLLLLSPLSASQHIVRRKQADKCSSVSWAHNSVSWGTANLIHLKAWLPSVILSLTYWNFEWFFTELNKTFKVLLSLQQSRGTFAVILCITCLNIMTFYIIYAYTVHTAFWGFEELLSAMRPWF